MSGIKNCGKLSIFQVKSLHFLNDFPFQLANVSLTFHFHCCILKWNKDVRYLMHPFVNSRFLCRCRRCLMCIV